MIDQGYSYLATMLDRQADFILEYHQKIEGKLSKKDINWSLSRVIFVSPSFSIHQKNSVNFKDVPFELWEIKRFENSLIAIEQCKPSSKESIEKLSKGNSKSTISKVSSAVKVLSEEDHVNSLDSSMKPVWSSLRERLEGYTDVSFGAVKQYVSWKRDNTAVCYIYFQKKQLHIRIVRGNRQKTGETSKNFFTIDDPKKLTKEHSRKWGLDSTRHSYLISLKKPEEIDYVMYLLEQKYSSLG